jgi:predicted nucleic acid-binding protein
LILVDTSVWVDHFRKPVEELEELLIGAFLVQHPFVTGELALGQFKTWRSILTLLGGLPPARVASESDFLTFIVHEGLSGTGIGFVDAHLLAACRLTPGTLLWSRDKRLDRWAEAAGIAWRPR